MSSLGEEQERWNSWSEISKSQMSTIVGDVLLTPAFIAYAGYFNQSSQFSSQLVGSIPAQSMFLCHI